MNKYWLDRRLRNDILTIVLVLATILLLVVQSNIYYNQLPNDLSLGYNSSNNLYKNQHISTNSNYTKRLPQAIIIGSRKCGTRALLKFLELNPAIRVAQSEVHFFDKPENYKLGLEWYKSQMPESSVNEITVEKSPAYFVTKNVPDRISAMNSSIKLILILRNPVTRLISDYSQLVANKIELTLKNYQYLEMSRRDSEINEAWYEAGKVFEKHVLRPDGGINDRWKAVKYGLYSEFLEKWRNNFQSSQIHIVDGEALIKDPYAEVRKVESFLRLGHVVQRDDFVFDPNKGYYCISNRRRSNESVSLPSGEQEFSINCLSKHKGRRHIIVPGHILDKLQKYYAPYNEYLFSLIEKQFDWS